jgi:tRNA-2-methylthio-N6-dimethylallyladenosine synthase
LEEEKLVDLVAGPDAYRDLPKLITEVEGGQKAVNVLLSREETYADISPVRLDQNGVTAFISIMRGCDNMCSFCVVPFTRGRERSRDPQTIVEEARELVKNGYREVTLLGQNVDSYRWNLTKKGEIEDATKPTVNFAQLLEMVALVDPRLRIRFSTSHPKDMTDEVLETMAKYPNICKYIHLPVQSGSTKILEKMNRGYTREWYIDRIDAIRKFMPDCAISTDIITGFCTETKKTIRIRYPLWIMCSMNMPTCSSIRSDPKHLLNANTKTMCRMKSNNVVLLEVIDKQQAHSLLRNQHAVGKTFEVLIEGTSKRSEAHLFGRNSQNAVIIFPKGNLEKGQYAHVKVTECTAATLVRRSSRILKFVHHECISSTSQAAIRNHRKHPGLNRALEVAIQVAPTDISILVTGESGTGKEIIPQVIHNLSSRKHGQYIAVNCGAIPEGTIDSELFGHEKGSFTGAAGARQGYFEVADGGTIFLDEVAELPHANPSSLLRVLETG